MEGIAVFHVSFLAIAQIESYHSCVRQKAQAQQSDGGVQNSKQEEVVFKQEEVITFWFQLWLVQPWFPTEACGFKEIQHLFSPRWCLPSKACCKKTSLQLRLLLWTMHGGGQRYGHLCLLTVDQARPQVDRFQHVWLVEKQRDWADTSCMVLLYYTLQAYHFFMLAQRQLYNNSPESGMKIVSTCPKHSTTIIMCILYQNQPPASTLPGFYRPCTSRTMKTFSLQPTFTPFLRCAVVHVLHTACAPRHACLNYRATAQLFILCLYNICI